MEIIFEVIDEAFEGLSETLAKVSNFGCEFKKVKIKDDSLTNKLKHDKRHLAEDTDTEEGSKSIKPRTKTVRLCCNEEMFHIIDNNIKFLVKRYDSDPMLRSELSSKGITKNVLNIFEIAFNTKFINDGMKKFNDSFFIFKFKGDNIKAFAGLMLRYIFCNIVNISNFTSNVLLNVGTPLDIADTIKCGFFAGQITLIVYYVGLAFVPISMFDMPMWAKVLLSVLAVILCYIIKLAVPYVGQIFPVPIMI